jgi:EAL domain-containing protein (putative c-di-GMP-specific phosphodiesterase class I)
VSGIIHPYHDHLDSLAARLAEQGGLGLLAFDASALREIEHEYGLEAGTEVRQRLLAVFEEQRGKDFRAEDVVALDQPFGLVFLLFLAPRRRQSQVVTPVELKAARSRLASALAPALGRAAFPYRKSADVETGAALALHNPLLHVGRVLERALREALESAAEWRQASVSARRERLQDLLLRERVVTAYQPIQRLADRSVLGYEALTRGARGTGLDNAELLFGAAAENGYVVELDRLCRRKALLNSGRIPSSARLFVNTLPATIRDPQFRGRALIDFLGRAQVAPGRIVIEITEKLVIENYSLFREAMSYYTDLGMCFAVDDVGTGYSGLEAIARLKPHFLKVDMSLVRDVHVSTVNREMVKAILSLGHGIGATVIAEGIQSDDEVRALQAMGVAYGQGFHLARPDAAPE